MRIAHVTLDGTRPTSAHRKSRCAGASRRSARGLGNLCSIHLSYGSEGPEDRADLTIQRPQAIRG